MTNALPWMLCYIQDYSQQLLIRGWIGFFPFLDDLFNKRSKYNNVTHRESR